MDLLTVETGSIIWYSIAALSLGAAYFLKALAKEAPRIKKIEASGKKEKDLYEFRLGIYLLPRNRR